MSATLLLRRVTLQGANKSWSWRFGTGITVLVGPVGVGKTTLLELVKHGFGGHATLTRTVRAAGKRVLVDVTVGTRDLVLVRGIGAGANVVQVLEHERGSLGRFDVAPSGEATTISDFLLDSLGIPRLTIPRSHQYTRISFNDVYAYLYLAQTEIDRSTIHHLDHARNVKRQQTFELLYRLLDSTTAQLKVDLAEAEAQRDRVAQRTRIVGEFLAQTGLPEGGELARRLELVATEEARIQGEIGRLAAAARQASTAADRERATARALDVRVADLRAEFARAQLESDGLRSVQAQLRLDHDRTVKAMVAGEIFSAFAFRSCPRCLQSLERSVADRACVVCGQPDPPAVDGLALDDERLRLEAQLVETDELLDETVRRMRDVEAKGIEDVAALAVARETIDRLTADAVAPYADAQAHLHEQLGGVRAQRQNLRQQQRVSAELEALHRQGQDLRAHAHELKQRLDGAQLDLEAGRARVLELSEIFGDIVDGLRLPWAEQATIDPDDYLPRIDGERLEALGSGGMKTIVNIAYFLANLTWSLREPTAMQPRLLIIDSPRKDHGAGAEDLRAADRIYQWMLRLQDTMRMPGPLGPDRPFQLIIADNDVPADVRARVRLLDLGYDTPLISEASADEPGS